MGMPDEYAATSYNPLLYSQLSSNEAVIQWCKINWQDDTEREQEENFHENHMWHQFKKSQWIVNSMMSNLNCMTRW